MAFITDITAVIDEAKFKESVNIMKILKPYRHSKKGSCYTVKASFEELEDIFNKLQGLKTVEVSAAVMAYIKEKCAKELSRIEGTRFFIQAQLDDKSVYNNPSSTSLVTLRPRHASVTPVQADLVRQRFITFYQRTASDLQVIYVSVITLQHIDLRKTFPHLLFKDTHKNTYEVTGPFMHIAKLIEFIAQNNSSSTMSPMNKGPTASPRSRTSGPSPKHNKNREEELCPICMDPIVSVKKETLRCKHSFCKDCLKTAFAYKPVCPTCGELYGTLTGTQPNGGRMTVKTVNACLPGYEKYETIVIDYYIPSGIQKEEHPNPGQPFEGVSRTAYLPDSPEGRKILKLLQKAFNQKLIFTVGRSTTSGRNNTVTWNDIHHKTSTHGGPTHYGYPDPEYLSRVRDELKVKGVE